jgi:hypothetical protein
MFRALIDKLRALGLMTARVPTSPPPPVFTGPELREGEPIPMIEELGPPPRGVLWFSDIPELDPRLGLVPDGALRRIPQSEIRPLWVEVDDPRLLPPGATPPLPCFLGDGYPYGLTFEMPEFEPGHDAGVREIRLGETLVAGCCDDQPDMFPDPEAMPQPQASNHSAAQETETMSTEQQAAAKSRKYRLRHTETGRERIIIATSPAQAVRFASRSDYECELLDADNALRMGAAGIVPETAAESTGTDGGDGAAG